MHRKWRSFLEKQSTKSGAGSFVIQTGHKILVILVGILFARTLGPEGYGIYSVAFAVIALLAVPAEMGLPTLVVREVAALSAKGDLRAVGNFSGKALASALCVSALVATVSALLVWLLFRNDGEDHAVTLLLACLLIVPAALLKVVTRVLQGIQRLLVGQALELLMRPLLAVIFAAASFWAMPDSRAPQMAVGIQVVAVVVTLPICAIAMKTYLAQLRLPRLSLPDISILKRALPFTLISSAAIVTSQADIMMLGWLEGSATAGIYRVAGTSAALVVFGLQVVNSVLSPRCAHLYALEEFEELQRTISASTKLSLAAATFVTLIVFLGNEALIAWVFGKEYVAAWLPLSILVIGQWFNAVFGSVGVLLNMTGNESIVAKAVWVSAFGNVVLNVILIPAFGMVGAACATVASLLYLNAVLFYAVKSKLGLSTAGI